MARTNGVTQGAAAGQRIEKPLIITSFSRIAESIDRQIRCQTGLVLAAQAPGRPGLGNQVRPEPGRQLQALVAPPALDLGVVARQQHLGHRHCPRQTSGRV